MAWIKRNLVFVIVAAVAVLALVGAGFYTWTGYQHNEEKLGKLNENYTELKRLTENPLIGAAGGKVDNIKLAAEQQKDIRNFLTKSGRQFQRIAPIPDNPKLARDEYTSVLRLTIDQLQREATNNSVVLPPKYSFSFEAQRQRTVFDNMPQLAVQLGEVKAICEILNKAKVNAIEGIRRERVSTDDDSGPPNDYVTIHSTTNDLAVLAPYEVTFRSFSPELGAVLAGFANSPNGLIIKSINVERESGPGAAAEPIMVTPTYVPPPPPPPQAPPQRYEGEAAFNSRYGPGKGAFPAPAPVAPQAYAVAPAGPKGMPVMLNEKQLKVTLLVMVVKMVPKKA